MNSMNQYEDIQNKTKMQIKRLPQTNGNNDMV